MAEVKTYAVNCNDAWLNTNGDDISDSYVKHADYLELAVQLANAESKCREMAAENAHARERHVFILALAVSILEHSGGRMDWRGAMEDATELLHTVDSVYAKTPATDSFLSEVRAQGVEMFALMYAEEAIKDGSDNTGWKSRASAAASEYAAQLRKGVQS